jgi:hypothetical protein
MVIEDRVRRRIADLVERGAALVPGTDHGQVRNEDHAAACIGWLGAAAHAVAPVCPAPTTAYRSAAKRIATHPRGYISMRASVSWSCSYDIFSTTLITDWSPA